MALSLVGRSVMGRVDAARVALASVGYPAMYAVRDSVVEGWLDESVQQGEVAVTRDWEEGVTIHLHDGGGVVVAHNVTANNMRMLAYS